MHDQLDEITHHDCMELLRFGDLGRIAVEIDGGPVIVPVNYRLVEPPGRTWIALRTRPGNLLDRNRVPAGFEIDHVDQVQHEGWSVLVRGTLLRVDPDAAGFRSLFDPRPWVTDERDRWLVIEPFSITGRRLRTHQPDRPIPALFFR
jgi:nitroimidazol reductase NimA-like FMN-containing flavoprotein (pyridoxamine 5'-phosphate oxidase superfamily)